MLASKLVFFPRLEGTEQYTRSPVRDQARMIEREVSAPISSTKTSRSGSTFLATITSRLLSATRPVPSPLHSVFLTEAKTLQQSSDGGGAQRFARCAAQEATLLGDRSGRALLYVVFEQLRCGFICLGRSATAFSRRE